MSANELAEGIQFVVDAHGTITSVVLTPDVWRKLVQELEDAEDRALLSKLAPKLAGSPDGAVRWSDVETDWA